MKYPYIGKVELGHIYLMVSESKGVIINSSVTRIGFGGDNPVNITREYLEGKCVKIESTEHSRFVQNLAFNAGFKWPDSFGRAKHTGFLYLSFKDSGSINCGHNNSKGVEEITIPLPPKTKADEWPKVGDTVTWGNRVTNGEVKAVDGDVAWIMNNHGNYVTEYLRDLVKPKTEAEILRDELILCIHDANQIWRDKISQDRNGIIDDSVYEFAVDKLLSKYSIKPQ